MNKLLLGLIVGLVAVGVYIYRGSPPANFEVVEGKKFLVTGGGSGIGEELALVITKWGGHVTVTGRTEAKLRRVCDRVAAAGHKGQCIYLVSDAADPKTCGSTVDSAAEKMNGLDVVIANHVTGRVAKLAELEDLDAVYAAYRKTFDANVFGSLCLAYASLPHFRRSTSKDLKPTFVQISSLSAFYGIARMSLYSGSKAAMHPAMNAFRVENPQFNWCVHNVGHVATEVAKNQMKSSPTEGMPPDLCAEMIVDRTIKGEREVFFPAVWKPMRFPGYLAFLLGTFAPATMEKASVENYGEDFVLPLDQPNPMKKA